jgi:hypothetical protein
MIYRQLTIELWISGGWEMHRVLMLFARVGSRGMSLCGFNIIFADYDVERVQKLRAWTMTLRRAYDV